MKETSADLESAILSQIPEHLSGYIAQVYRGRHESLEDAVVLAAIAMRNRAMTHLQQAIAGAMRVINRAGMKAPKDFGARWKAAGEPVEAPAKKPAVKKAKVA